MPALFLCVMEVNLNHTKKDLQQDKVST